MPNADNIYNSDICCYPEYNKKEDCHCHDGMYWGPPVPPPPPPYIPPVPPMPPDYPYPPRPIPPCPCPCPDEDVKKNSIEGQICKLSKKASTINKMLKNLEDRKKDVFIKIGEVSYNFGNIDAEVADWDDGNYAGTVKRILENERSVIQAEIKTLADELDD